MRTRWEKRSHSPLPYPAKASSPPPSRATTASSSERLLYAFTRAFIADPRGGPPLDEEARKVYGLLQAQVEQFRKRRGPAAMKYEELMSKSLEEILEPVLEAMPTEKRLRGLSVEQRLAGLSVEQIVKGLNALPPEVLAELKRLRG
jgi:hypothetical protein